MPKHHYVPQFYLKRFGNGKYVSAIFMDYNFRFVEKVSIRDQSIIEGGYFWKILKVRSTDRLSCLRSAFGGPC